MEYHEYSDYIDAMELYVETLTGTIFVLQVSPFETVISVKAKIQHVEGIPIGQQHLVYRSIELEDDYCLQDYGIHPGASLKLVLAMRGGPINTRRIPMEDPAIREMADYMEANKDEIWEKLPGNRQVTLLVFREGDQLNFFRVVDRGDGTLTPLSESLSGASVHNGEYEEVEDNTKELTVEQVKENDAVMNKMKLLRAKMENLSVVKKQTKIPRPPPRPRSSSKRHASSSSLRNLRVTSMNKVVPLPPVRGSLEKDSGASDSSTKSDLVHDLRARGRSGPPVRQSSSHEDLRSGRTHCGPVTAGVPSTLSEQRELSLTNKTTVPPSLRRSEVKESLIRPRVLSGKRTCLTTDMTIKRSDIEERRHSPLPNVLAQQNLEKLRAKFHKNHRKQSSNLPHFAQGSKVDDIRPATSSQRVTVSTQPESMMAAERLSLGTADARVVTDLVNQANREGKINNIVRTSQRDPLTGISSSRARISPSPALLSRVFNGSASVTRTGHAERISTPEARQSLISAHSVRGRFSGGRDGRIAISPVCRLPPVVNSSVSPKKKSSKRCYLCNKKTGLATSYQCRCGHNYCASHRYAEAHSCGFDYKSEGRKLLEQSNPIISAPKLPKI